MRRWELVGDGSAKFWEAAADGASVQVRYGRIGAAGRTQVKDLADGDAAGAHLAKLIAEKERKGYRETAAAGATPTPAPAPAAVPESVDPAATTGSVVPAAATEPTESVEPALPAELPDEDAFVLPASWLALVAPRRGGGVPLGPARPYWTPPRQRTPRPCGSPRTRPGSSGCSRTAAPTSTWCGRPGRT
ncbi:WGR domain-containing protein [Kitasatospora cheerisanensis]|uniref:WGR domain-containing protein n=1 Tax=Kitasatospora cheerisanensis KCTC 2395 TaxID=1348663 RepID=A0A066ZAZ7_9ACTN|nr:WGR domain-containing protein [Kitasatospora cheerisanensis]KDN87310.1 hypothetical protein KCH_09370 [Kitasatospora cheerisanensis KCTC 2395]